MKKILLGICSILLIITLASCGEQHSKYNLKSANEKISYNYSDFNSDDMKIFLDKLDTFSAKLTEKVYKNSDKNTNICISPISVYMALAMAIECASGETRNEMLNAVGVTYEEVIKFTEYLYSYCNREFKSTTVFDKKKIIGLEMLSNSIWIDDRVKLKDECLDVLANSYNCDSYYVPFYNSNKKANKALASYVKEKTNGLIDSDFNLSVDTIFTLVNTFYLKDVWNNDGDDLSFTKDIYEFKEYDGNIVKTKLLSGYYNPGKPYITEKYSYAYTKTNHNFNIKFIVPNDGYTLDDILNEGILKETNSLGSYKAEDNENLQSNYTRCYFPEFEASYDNDIKDVLYNDFGIKTLFDPSGLACDFSNITDDDVYCSGVIHKTKLKVDKTGIEGAAVTIMVMDVTSSGPEYEKVYYDYVVDKSFAYIVTDNFGITLFSGVICNI